MMEFYLKCFETLCHKSAFHPQECTAETEELYKMHRHKVNDAVYEVQKNLVSNRSKRVVQRSSCEVRCSLVVCFTG